jgi:hypothetical protein
VGPSGMGGAGRARGEKRSGGAGGRTSGEENTYQFFLVTSVFLGLEISHIYSPASPMTDRMEPAQFSPADNRRSLTVNNTTQR